MFVFIFILFTMCFVAFALQSTYLNKRLIILYSVISFIFMYSTHNYAIEESYNSVLKIISNKNIMYIFSIVVTIEAILGVLYNFNLIGGDKKDKIRYLKYFPSASYFISLYFAQVFVFLNFTSKSFTMLSIISGIVFALVFLLIAFYFKADSNKSLNLDLKFIIHILQIISAAIISVIYSGFPLTNSHKADINLMPFVALVLIAIPAFIIGIIYNKYYIKKLGK